MSTTQQGNRRSLPKNADRICSSCLTPRGNTVRGWVPITRASEVLGYTCPACPTWDEPIRREPSGRFLVVVGVPTKDAKRRQLKRRFDHLSVAREWVAEMTAYARRLRAGQDPGSPDDYTRLTVREISEAWIAMRREQVGTPGAARTVTINGYETAISGLLDHIGHMKARDVDPEVIEAALRSLAVKGKRQKGLKHRSLVYALGTLRQVYKYALRKKWVLDNPAADAKVPRATQQTAEEKAAAKLRWTPAQLATFRAYADTYAEPDRFAADPWVQAAMRLTLCGLRRSEIMALDWSRVLVDVGSVVVEASRVKTGRGNATETGLAKSANSVRVVNADAIHPGTAKALRKLWLAQGRPESGLVVRNRHGVPLDPDLHSDRFRAMCKNAGVPVLVSIHNVRHSIATALKAAGVPDHEAAALLGHDVQTYRRFYLVTDDDGAAAAAEAAGRVFR